MAAYYVYNPTDPTGRILRVGMCPDNMVAAQAREGESAATGIVNPLTQKIVDGAPADKSPEEIAADQLPPVPDDDRPARLTRLIYRLLVQRLDNFDTRTDALTAAAQNQAARIAALETQNTDQATRIGTLETQAADQAQRIVALEAKVGITPGKAT